MKTILITAYAVNPYKGSEDGVGWNISHQISKHHKVILITRENNIPHIEKYAEEHPESASNLEYHGFDLPAWAMWLKKRLGERGYVLYFYFWQMFVALFAKRKGFRFDIAHSLNFHSDSHPNFLWMLGKPTFWGPVGHHPKVPREFLLRQYGFSTYLKDRTYFLVKWIMRNLDPFFRLSVQKSVRIFGINSSVQQAMRASQEKVQIIPAVASEPVTIKFPFKEGFKVLSVGRFHYMKGFDISIRAFAQFHRNLDAQSKESARLVLVGKGEEKGRLQRLSKELGIDSFIDWIDWVDKSKMDELYRNSSVFLFPSHEGAGMVIPEAMSYKLPVICFDNCGPGELAEEGAIKVGYETYASSVNEFAKSLKALYNNPDKRKQLGLAGLKRFQERFSWTGKGKTILEAYDAIVETNNRKDKTVAVFHPSSELYGADRIMVNALNALPPAVHKKVYLKFEGPLVSYIKENVENVDVQVNPDLPIIYRKIFTVSGVFNLLVQWIRFAAFLKKENHRFKFSSAYLNTLSTSLILPLVKWNSIKSFVHVHEIIDNPKLIGWVTGFMCRYFSNQVVCVSAAVRAGMARYIPSLGEQALILHNGIDEIHTAPITKKGPLKFYLFGRLMPKKGQWYLLDSLSLIPKQLLARCQFVLMGGVLKGHEHLKVELEEKIQNLGLSQFVELREFAPDISEAMSDAHICLVPSLMKDPFPTTVLEAMSAGKPVVATNHGGAKEAITDGENGLLVGPNQPQKLAQLIKTLIQDNGLRERLGENAKDHFKSNFTRQHFNQNWMRFNSVNGFV